MHGHQHGSPTTWVVIALSGYNLIFLVWHLVGIFRLLAWVRGNPAPIHRLDRLVNLVWATLLLLLVITMGVEFTLFLPSGSFRALAYFTPAQAKTTSNRNGGRGK